MRKINTEQFDELIYDNEAVALVFFHRRGCHVCEELSGFLEELEDDLSGDVLFAETDVEEENDLFSRFGLKGVPQTILFSNGNLVKTLSGRKDDEEYEQALNELIGG